MVLRYGVLFRESESGVADFVPLSDTLTSLGKFNLNAGGDPGMVRWGLERSSSGTNISEQ